MPPRTYSNFIHSNTKRLQASRIFFGGTWSGFWSFPHASVERSYGVRNFSHVSVKEYAAASFKPRGLCWKARRWKDLMMRPPKRMRFTWQMSEAMMTNASDCPIPDEPLDACGGSKELPRSWCFLSVVKMARLPVLWGQPRSQTGMSDVLTLLQLLMLEVLLSTDCRPSDCCEYLCNCPPHVRSLGFRSS